MYEIVPSQTNMTDANEITAIFDQKGILCGLSLVFPKYSEDVIFEKMLSTLKSKYKLVSSKIPFVGDKSAKFATKNTLIYLDSPHLSFETTLNYYTKAFLKIIDNTKKEEKIKKQKSIENNL